MPVFYNITVTILIVLIFANCANNRTWVTQSMYGKTQIVKKTRTSNSDSHWEMVNSTTFDSNSKIILEKEKYLRKISSYGPNPEIFYKRKEYADSKLTYKSNLKKSKTFIDGIIVTSTHVKFKTTELNYLKITTTKNFDNNGKLLFKSVDTLFSEKTSTNL